MLESDLKEAIRLCNVQREKIEHLQRCLSIALPSGAEEETTGLGEEQEQELSPSLQQHFAEWQKLDGCLQALKQTNDKSLREDFEQFADVKKEAEDNNAEPGSVESSPSKTIAARAEAGAAVCAAAAGNGRVDPNCGVSRASLCRSLKDGAFLDAMCNKSDLQANANHFYIVQLVASGNDHYVFARWGRVGTSGSVQLNGPLDREQGEKEFKKKFKDKTANDWDSRGNFVPKSGKYDLVNLDATNKGKAPATTPAAAPVASAGAGGSKPKTKQSEEDSLHKIRMSKQGLAAFFAAKKITLREGEVEELLSRFDTNSDGEVDWREFLALVRSNTELEMVFKALPLHRVLASCFPRGAADDPLGPFFRQQHNDVVAAVHMAAHLIVLMTMDVMKKHNEAHASGAAGGAKFGAELKGSEVEAFFEGITGIVGEPHPDLERGIAEEHLLKKDSNECYTTSNYAVSTTPAIEFGLVMKVMGISTGSASKVLQDFITSGGKGSDGWLTRGPVTRKKVTAHGQTLDKVLVPETRCCRQRGGGVPEDLRVLYPIEVFGDFGEDGRLKSFLVCDTDTPLQKKVKKAKLTRMEIIVIILYTGPCFMLYNGMLRGFGDCGEVPSDVESKSDDFWKHLKKVSVNIRMEKAGHKYSSTMHALASGIKKLQAIAEGGQGTRLYRGVGGLDVRPFMKKGFTETAFMSSTASLEVALDYSGVKAGKVGVVLAMELSSLDNGADICDFSQYPGERETVWNTCSYLEYYHGRDEIHVTPYGVVKVLLVKANANTKALTVEELEMRRKNVVVAFFDTIQNDVVREIDRSVQTKEFQKRLEVQRQKRFKEAFITSIKSESASRAEVYKTKPAVWFASNTHLGKAVLDGLALSTLAKAKYALWLRDEKLDLYDMGFQEDKSTYHDYQRSYVKLLALQRQELMEAEEAAASEVQGSNGDAVKRLQTLTLEECVSRRWVAGEDELELADETTSLTPLWQHLSLGDVKVAERLLQARASPEHVPSQDKEGKTPLLWASKEGYADAALLLLKYKADTEATDKDGSTALLFASRYGHTDTVRVLVSHGASVEVVDKNCGYTALMLASINGDMDTARVLVEFGASVEAVDKEYGRTALLFASRFGHADMVRVLVELGASVEAVDTYGETALRLAERRGNSAVVALLKEPMTQGGST